MVSIAVLGVVTAIAMPSLSEFRVKMRVDNEIAQLQRMVLTTRNTAINLEQNVTLCPLNGSNTCTNNWAGELTVFVDLDQDNVFEPGAVPAEILIKIKKAVSTTDTLNYTGFSRITFASTGLLLINSGSGTFSYCPNGYSHLNRAVIVSPSGRTYQSTDTDNDGEDEDRNNSAITCP